VRLSLFSSRSTGGHFFNLVKGAKRESEPSLSSTRKSIGSEKDFGPKEGKTSQNNSSLQTKAIKVEGGRAPQKVDGRVTNLGKLRDEKPWFSMSVVGI